MLTCISMCILTCNTFSDNVYKACQSLSDFLQLHLGLSKDWMKSYIQVFKIRTQNHEIWEKLYNFRKKADK